MRVGLDLPITRLAFSGSQLISEMGAYLLRDGQCKSLSLKRLAVGILVQRKGHLLLDLQHLGNEFFQLQAPNGAGFVCHGLPEK
jgi:hypothetical protein